MELVSRLPDLYARKVQDIETLLHIQRPTVPFLSWFSVQVDSRENPRSLIDTFFPRMIHTAGLGFITGLKPEIYIQVVKPPALIRFRQELRDTLAAGVPDEAPWKPCIPLSFEMMTPENIQEAVESLAGLTLNWEFQIDSLSWME